VNIPEIDLYRTAALMVEQHGDDAEWEAAKKADAFLDRGDIIGVLPLVLLLNI
tara:strand:- start:299 stop:457 length:159 start_codon:yes stop_codon:yes gene_type:complete